MGLKQHNKLRGLWVCNSVCVCVCTRAHAQVCVVEERLRNNGVNNENEVGKDTSCVA